MLQPYQKEFIQLALDCQVLKFGEFTLKSGRKSPYFFNAGQFYSGAALSALGHFYAQSIVNLGIEFDSLFGPAYKGIPLVASVAIALARDFGINKPYSFNRKEVKDHGEGGVIVGAPLEGRVLIVDDVITAGTAMRQSVTIIKEHHASVAGIMLAFDRQERGQGDLSAVQELQNALHVPVASIIAFEQLREFIGGDVKLKQALADYHQQYGI